jgi:hypothetical protein
MNRQLEAALTLARLAGARDLAELAAKDNADAETAGRRVLLAAYALDPALIGTQRQLGSRMGLSESRVSRMCKVLRRSLSRQFKAVTPPAS